MENNKQNIDYGSLAGIIIIVIILVTGIFYLAGQRIEKSKEFKTTLNQNSVVDTATSSDEISDIENSVNSMNFNDLGSGISNL